MITFNEMPEALSALKEDVRLIKEFVLNNSKQEKEKKWFDIDQLCDYLPHHPVKSSIYGLVHRGEIPNMKQGKKLIFSKDEIDIWLQSHRRKTKAELQEQTTSTADSFLVSKKKKGGANE